MLKNLNILLKPLLPRFTASIESQLGVSDLAFKDLDFSLKGKINKAEIIFQKLEDINLFGEENSSSVATSAQRQ